MLTCSLMAFRDDMVDLEREPIAILRNLTVFATIARTLPNQNLQRAFHSYSMRSWLLLVTSVKTALEGSASLGLHNVQQMADQLIFPRLSIFLRSERPCARFRRQLSHPILVSLIEIESKNILRPRARESRCIWPQDSVQD